MGEKKPYEEGSVLMGAPKHDTMWELAELARENGKETWRLETNVIACKELDTIRSHPQPHVRGARRQLGFFGLTCSTTIKSGSEKSHRSEKKNRDNGANRWRRIARCWGARAGHSHCQVLTAGAVGPNLARKVDWRGVRRRYGVTNRAC